MSPPERSRSIANTSQNLRLKNHFPQYLTLEVNLDTKTAVSQSATGRGAYTFDHAQISLGASIYAYGVEHREHTMSVDLIRDGTYFGKLGPASLPFPFVISATRYELIPQGYACIVIDNSIHALRP